MASKPKKAAKAAQTIADRDAILIFRCPYTTDPAVGSVDRGPSDYFMSLDKPTQGKVMAVRLQAEADVHKALAEANAHMASILKSGG